MTRKRLIWISDFLLGKDGTPLTGYGNISDYYCKELIKEYNIIALGYAYGRNQHNYVFSLTHTPVQSLGTAIQSINSTYPIDYIISACDIPLQNQILKIPRAKSKYIGIFAVESSPLYAPWAMELAVADYKFPISEFGKQECEKAGLDAKHLVIPVDRKLWFPRELGEKEHIKEMLGVKDKIVLFVNAAGNERKNLATILEALRDALKQNNKYYLFMLVNVNSQVSWDLRELVTRFDLNRNVTLFDKGLSQPEVRRLYAGADFFINISKAEGMCFPILEAQSVGVPVIATNCTAMKEHLSDKKGISIEPDFKLIDVFGNSDRFYVIPETLTKTLLYQTKLLEEFGKQEWNHFKEMTKKAQKYIDERNASNSLELLRNIIDES